MTTWELPNGYGRLKPDICTYSTHILGSKKDEGCRTLSGTSVASPIVAGAIALLLSSYKEHKLDNETNMINPASIKQIIMSSADRIKNANMFEQGFGKLNLIQAYNTIKKYKPQISLIPSYLDLTECPYFWPYCTQPLYYSAIPVIVNVTILNGISVNSRIVDKPKWHPSLAENGHYLRLSFSRSSKLWPWSGYLAIKISVAEEAKDYDGLVEGEISFTVETILENNEIVKSQLKLYLKAKIIPKPLRQQRILWDQFHNIRYPPGYFPRDDLKMKIYPLDWNADHVGLVF